MIKCYASGGSGIKGNRSNKVSDGTFKFSNANTRKDLANKRALGLNPAFMGTVQVKGGKVVQMTPSNSYGYRVASALNPTLNMRTVIRPRRGSKA